jgi:Ca-activated chloride channel family protein
VAREGGGAVIFGPLRDEISLLDKIRKKEDEKVIPTAYLRAAARRAGFGCASLLLLAGSVVPGAAQLTSDKALLIHRADLTEPAKSVVFLSALQLNWRANQEPIMGITPLDLPSTFEVYLDKQQIKQVQAQRFTESPLGIDVVLAIDISGSVYSQFALMQEAVKAYVDRLRPGRDQAAVLTFGTDVQMAEFPYPDGRYSPFTDKVADLQNAIGTPPARARKAKTVLYKAITEAVEKAQVGRLNPAGIMERAVIVLSDGHDEGSVGYDIGAPIEAAKKAHVPVFSLGLPEPATKNQYHDVLDRISKESGAVFVPIQDLNRLKAVYEKLDTLLKSQYVLTFSIPLEAQDGKDHVLHVLSAHGGTTLSAKFDVATPIHAVEPQPVQPSSSGTAATGTTRQTEQPKQQVGVRSFISSHVWLVAGCGGAAVFLILLIIVLGRTWALKRHREREDDDATVIP